MYLVKRILFSFHGDFFNVSDTFSLTFWCRNYFFLILAHLYINVNNTGTKYVRIMKQTAF